MGSSNETSYFGPVVSPWRRRARTQSSCPAAPRAVRRRRWRPSSALGAVGTDTGGSIRQPAALHRHRRHEADLRPLLALGHRGFASSLDQAGPFARSVRDARDPAALDGRATIRRTRPAPNVPVPDYEAVASAHRSRACASAFPRNTASPAWRPRSRDLWEQRRAMAQGTPAPRSSTFRCRTPSTRWPAYYIVAPAEASSNLARYDGVRYGLRRSRPRRHRDV